MSACFAEVCTVFFNYGSILLHTPYVIWFNGKFFTIVGRADCPFSFHISTELRKIVNCIYDSKRSYNVGNSKWNSGATVSIKFWSNTLPRITRRHVFCERQNGGEWGCSHIKGNEPFIVRHVSEIVSNEIMFIGSGSMRKIHSALW